MISQINNFRKAKPFITIIILAAFFRLLAVIFSQGYGMHDDHFSIIEASQSWADGTDYNDWLPSTQQGMKYRLTGDSFLELKKNNVPDSIIKKLEDLKKRPFNHEADFTNAIEKYLTVRVALQYMDKIVKSAQLGAIPDGHSFFYVGIHYILFATFDAVGFSNPKAKMYLIRLLHALLSMIVVVYGYKIVKKISSNKNAFEIGLLLAIAWFMPFLSVRNLNEIASIPFLFLGLWILLKNEKPVLTSYFYAGLVMALAFSVRFQTSFFIAGAGLALLILKRWKGAFIFGAGVILSILIVQGLTDFVIWGRPFAELTEYILYNLKHKHDYGVNNPEMYFLVLVGIMVPPLGLLYFFGFLRTFKKHLIIFLPTFLFFAFHTYFPNKQERFIFPIIPTFIMLSVIGWNEFKEKSKFWAKYKGLYRGFFVFFWTINLIMLPVFSTFYSKKPRCEAMYYFYNKKDVSHILIEETHRGGATSLPNYYSGRWINMYKLSKLNDENKDRLWSYQRNKRHVKVIFSFEYFKLNPQEDKPQYILFFNEKNLKSRIKNAKKYFPEMKQVKVIHPSLGDKIMYKLNPVNKNVPIFVFSTGIKDKLPPLDI